MAVAITGLLKFVMMDWLQMRVFFICGACLFWLAYVLTAYKSDHAILKYWGFKKENFRKSLLILLPFTLVSIIAIVFYAAYNEIFMLNWHIIPVFLLYPLWGLAQQFMTAGLIAGNLASIKNSQLKPFQVIFITSLIFGLVHYPRLSLMAFTFVMQLVFTLVYLRWRNLWALGLAHGWIATFLLFYALKRDLWIELFAWF